MFYDYGLGEAQYKYETGIINGKLTLKRQFKIINGEIDYMIDTNLKIDDEILQEILSKSTSGKMEHIISSIQRQQNQVIRDDEHDLLIVQGSAGSGKTSIALHRVAYLLYKHRKSIKADNIMIFSPNQIFNDYISNVLPELGEENMEQTTFQDFCKWYLDDFIVAEGLYDQMEFLLSGTEDSSVKYREYGIKLKSSSIFYTVINNYLEDLLNDGLNFKDLFHNGEIIVSKEELKNMWQEKYTFLSFKRKLLKIKRRLCFLIKKRKKELIEEMKEDILYIDSGTFKYPREIVARVREEFKPCLRTIKELTSINVFNLYSNLFKDTKRIENYCFQEINTDLLEKMCLQTLNSLESNFLLYEDLAPYTFFKANITGKKAGVRGIKHIIVDEAQDYSQFQYEILKHSFPDCNFSLLGDLNQSIHPSMEKLDYKKIREIFKEKKSKTIKLKKSYRSTLEIVKFTKAILPDREEIEGVERPGNKPEIIKVKGKGTNNVIVNTAITSKENGSNSIAIICKTAKESQKKYRQLKDELEVHLLTKDDQEFKKGIVIIPSYLVKGLEFDTVIINMDSKNNYNHVNERRLFYTVCTRALHQLYIVSTGELSPIISEIDENLYKKIII